MIVFYLCFFFFPAAAFEQGPGSEIINVAVYRGKAGCPGCSEMVVKALRSSGHKLNISYIGENEKIKINDGTLKNFDLYIQPGGGQDIPAAYQAIGDDGASAIRHFVRSGKNFLGLCMGAYLADKDWLGLIDAQLDSEVGRPHSGIYDEGDYTLRIKWNNNVESFYYQDGPYLIMSVHSDGYEPIAYYSNGDVAITRYYYGKGIVILSGPHPEADQSWFDNKTIGSTSAGSKLKRIIEYFQLKTH